MAISCGGWGPARSRRGSITNPAAAQALITLLPAHPDEQGLGGDQSGPSPRPLTATVKHWRLFLLSAWGHVQKRGCPSVRASSLRFALHFFPRKWLWPKSPAPAWLGGHTFPLKGPAVFARVSPPAALGRLPQIRPRWSHCGSPGPTQSALVNERLRGSEKGVSQALV